MKRTLRRGQRKVVQGTHGVPKDRRVGVRAGAEHGLWSKQMMLPRTFSDWSFVLGDEHSLFCAQLTGFLLCENSTVESSILILPDSALRSRWIHQNRERVILALVESLIIDQYPPLIS